MFIDQIAAGVAFIYNALVKLVALSTPVLAILSLPIGSSIMDSVYAMVEQKDSERIAFELKKTSKRLTLLLLPFALGVFAIARLIFTRTPNILPVSIKYLEKFELGGIIVICFLPGAIGAFKSLMAGKSGAARRAGSWLGFLWLLLYSLLGLLFLVYLV